MTADETIRVLRTDAQHLVRKALDALAAKGAGESLDVPATVGEAWLRRHVARLHKRSDARFRVRLTDPNTITVVRMADAPESLL